jgi:hypothetical protein
MVVIVIGSGGRDCNMAFREASQKLPFLSRQTRRHAYKNRCERARTNEFAPSSAPPGSLI